MKWCRSVWNHFPTPVDFGALMDVVKTHVSLSTTLHSTAKTAPWSTVNNRWTCWTRWLGVDLSGLKRRRKAAPDFVAKMANFWEEGSENLKDHFFGHNYLHPNVSFVEQAMSMKVWFWQNVIFFWKNFQVPNSFGVPGCRCVFFWVIQQCGGWDP